MNLSIAQQITEGFLQEPHAAFAENVCYIFHFCRVRKFIQPEQVIGYRRDILVIEWRGTNVVDLVLEKFIVRCHSFVKTSCRIPSDGYTTVGILETNPVKDLHYLFLNFQIDSFVQNPCTTTTSFAAMRLVRQYEVGTPKRGGEENGRSGAIWRGREAAALRRGDRRVVPSP